MGGTGIAMDQREAASILRWWLDAGVDLAVQEEARNWLEREQAPPAADLLPEAPSEAAPLPESLDAFRHWLSTSAGAPLADSRTKAVLPAGSEGAEIMLLSDPPGRDELASGEPIGGEPAALMRRMLAAIDLEGQAYSANLSCFHSPQARLSEKQLNECGEAARRHVALAKPKRLLLLGDAPCRALLGKTMLQARGHVHKVEGVRTIATFHPRQLLKRPSDKALAWRDLLLLMEETP